MPNADFVIEGYVDPTEPLGDEGPFGDHTGYYTLPEPYPVFHVTAITHRKDAVYPATIVGMPPMEDFYIGGASVKLFLPIFKMNFPEIVDIALPAEGVFHNLVFVSIRKTYPMQAYKIMHGLWGMGQMMFTKYIIVVDADVDVHNTSEVLFRLCANTDPQRDSIFTKGPSDVLDHATSEIASGSKLGIDATKKIPDEGFKRPWPPLIKMDAAVKAKVERLFKSESPQSWKKAVDHFAQVVHIHITMSKELDMAAVENCVCFNLRWVTRAVTQFYDAEMRRHGIRPTQGSILVSLNSKDSWNMAELSDWLGMERTTLVRNLRPLQRDGFVKAVGGGRGNRVELTITTKGRNQVEKLTPAWKSAQSAVVKTLGEKRWSAILSDLETAALALNK